MHRLQNLFLLTVTLIASPFALAQEWTTLFDGSGLENFNRLGDAEWNIIEDYVESDGYRGSYLVTREDYGDFELEVEFWPSADANSGIYVRNTSGEKIAADAGYEINIFDTNDNPDNRTGAIIFFAPPMVEIIAGEKWNTYKIRAEGSRITAHLNGTLVADLDDDTYASGPIALQANGGLIRFRNVRVRPL